MRRRPIFVYLLTWITCGIYGVVWYFRVMDLLNKRIDDQKFNIRFWAWSVGIYFTIHSVCVLAFSLFWEVSPVMERVATLLFPVLFVLGILWNLVLLPYAVLAASRRIRGLQDQVGIAETLVPRRAVFAYFLWFLALPYLQHHLNIALDAEPRLSMADRA